MSETDSLDELRALYQETILDHSRHPRNFGPAPEGARKARGYNPLCGDQVTIHVTPGDRDLLQVGFEGRGCALCLASASMLTEAVSGRDEAAAGRLFEAVKRLCTESDYSPPPDEPALASLMALSGVSRYPVRVKCATLPWHTLKAALEGRQEATTE